MDTTYYNAKPTTISNIGKDVTGARTSNIKQSIIGYNTMFTHCLNPDDAKKKYAELLQTGTHPLAELTASYLAVLQTFSGKTYTGTKADQSTYQYTYQLNPALESQFIEIVQALCSLQMPQVSISVRGTWLWIEGDTKPFATQLKGLRCRFNARRTAETGTGVWNWTPEGTKVMYKYRSKLSHDDIKVHYGNNSAVR